MGPLYSGVCACEGTKTSFSATCQGTLLLLQRFLFSFPVSTFSLPLRVFFSCAVEGSLPLIGWTFFSPFFNYSPMYPPAGATPLPVPGNLAFHAKRTRPHGAHFGIRYYPPLFGGVREHGPSGAPSFGIGDWVPRAGRLGPGSVPLGD